MWSAAGSHLQVHQRKQNVLVSQTWITWSHQSNGKNGNANNSRPVIRGLQQLTSACVNIFVYFVITSRSCPLSLLLWTHKLNNNGGPMRRAGGGRERWECTSKRLGHKANHAWVDSQSTSSTSGRPKFPTFIAAHIASNSHHKLSMFMGGDPTAKYTSTLTVEHTYAIFIEIVKKFMLQ